MRAFKLPVLASLIMVTVLSCSCAVAVKNAIKHKPDSAIVPVPSVVEQALQTNILRFDSLVLLTLNFQSESRRTEFVFCLTGEVRDSVTHITGIQVPNHVMSTDSSVQSARCNPFTTVALWHNHPEHHYSNPTRGCGLSVADAYNVLKLGHPFSVIHVGGGTHCWFSHNQVLVAWLAKGPTQVWSIEGQRNF